MNIDMQTMNIVDSWLNLAKNLEREPCLYVEPPIVAIHDRNDLNHLAITYHMSINWPVSR